jgi:predicted Zn-dependent protease
VPAGKIESERLLVEYQCQTSAKPATLAVSVASIDPSASLTEYVTKSSLTGEAWRISGPVENFTINNVPAVRINYTLRADNEEFVREIVAFRRGERVYFFKGVCAGPDARSRREIRSALETVVW